MNTEKILALIKESKLLTEAERVYWLQNAATLSPEQFAKLEHILTNAKQLKWTAQMEQYMNVVKKGQSSSLVSA